MDISSDSSSSDSKKSDYDLPLKTLKKTCDLPPEKSGKNYDPPPKMVALPLPFPP